MALSTEETEYFRGRMLEISDELKKAKTEIETLRQRPTSDEACDYMHYVLNVIFFARGKTMSLLSIEQWLKKVRKD